jgi:hypothetical protein
MLRFSLLKGVTQGVTIFTPSPQTLVTSIKNDLQGGVQFPTFLFYKTLDL